MEAGVTPIGSGLTVGSLFSGIGGFDLGLEWAGFQVRWQVEIVPRCSGVLAKHWPKVVRYGDITRLDPTELEPVDLICGGFPCQPVSCAGRRRGGADPRWLWPEFVRIIRGVGPRWVLAENVPGLLSIDSGRLFGGVLRDLATLGYDAEWSVLAASDVGAPHERERVFVVAHAYNAGRREQRRPSSNGQTWSGTECYVGRPHQCTVGRDIYGFSARLERSSFPGWPACPGELQHPYEPSRVVGGIPGRVARIRALGNAVVPQVAEALGRYIMAREVRLSAREEEVEHEGLAESGEVSHMETSPAMGAVLLD